jgi:hypothetical protein
LEKFLFAKEKSRQNRAAPGISTRESERAFYTEGRGAQRCVMKFAAARLLIYTARGLVGEVSNLD